MANDIKNKAVSGVIWGFFERFSVQIFAFVQGIILARLLSPSDYGLIAMATVFNVLSITLVDSGFATSLIRKKNRTPSDYSTVFVTNIIISIVLAFLLCFCAPFIASFYKEPLLSKVIKANAILLILNSFAVVPLTRLQADMSFKVRSTIRIVTSFVNGISAIIMAILGFGVWSLVYPSYLSALVTIALLWYYLRWFPSFSFSFKSFRDLFSVGSNFLISSCVNEIYNNIYPIVIGKCFTSSDLGFYSKGSHFASLPATTISNMLGDISFPLLSSIQDDLTQLKLAYKRLIRSSVLVVFPVMVGIAAVAKPLILLLITEKWAPSILYLQILCFSMMWYPVHALNVSLLKVIGRSDLFLRIEIIKKVVGVVILAISIPFGIVSMCIGSVVSSLLSLFINTYYTGKFIHVGFISQVKDIFPFLIISLIMGCLVLLVSSVFSSHISNLILGVITGIIVYIVLIKMICEQDYVYIMKLVKGYLSR